MDWNLAIDKNRAALKAILAMLVAMIAAGGVDLRAKEDAGTADADPRGAGDRPATLPRHLHRFVLRLLRPAESAVRRLIIIAARGLVVELPPQRIREARPKPNSIFVRDGFGTGIVIRP